MSYLQRLEAEASAGGRGERKCEGLACFQRASHLSVGWDPMGLERLTGTEVQDGETGP